MHHILACKHTHNAVKPPPIHLWSFFSAAASVSAEQKKRRQSISSKVDSSDVQSASTGTQHYCTKTGSTQKGLSASGQSRKPIPELTLADHDASQTTLEDYYSVQYSQTTPVSTYPPYEMTPDRKEQIRRCCFHLVSECVQLLTCIDVYCTCESIYRND